MRIIKGNIITPYEIIRNGAVVIKNGFIDDIIRILMHMNRRT